jgi:hypothetical protein
MIHAALLLLMLEAVTTDLVLPSALKRSTQDDAGHALRSSSEHAVFEEVVVAQGSALSPKQGYRSADPSQAATVEGHRNRELRDTLRNFGLKALRNGTPPMGSA